MSLLRYSFPTQVISGPNASDAIAGWLQERGCRAPLVVTDSGLANLPLISDFMDQLRGGGVIPSLFSDLGGNPVKSQVTAGVEAYKQSGSDAIVGVGGGAAMDVAKAIALMVNHPGDLFDYEDGKPGALPVDQPIPPMVMVATTAGTGSEVGRSSVISDDETKVKKIIFDPKMLPNLAILDPNLMLSLPPGITATTGLDALCHLVEAFVAKGTHPMADGIALEGIRMVAENLRDAFDFARLQYGTDEEKAASQARLGENNTESRHIEARENMLNASMMGAVAFQKGLGVTHSLAHSLSTVCDLHHGLANGILMPHAMRFNAKAVPQRFVRMAQAAGLNPATPDSFIDWLVQLQDQLSVPRHLKPAGVKEEHLDALVHFAVLDGCHQSNPCPVSEVDFRTLFHDAIGA